MSLTQALPLLPGLVIGLTVHEFAHAWTASLLGDEFPRRQGRVSLNPFRHLSILGTLAIFLLPFGWGRPVQVNLYNFRRPRLGYLLTSLAGPLANVIIVAVCFVLMQLTRRTYALGWAGEVWLGPAHSMLMVLALINGMLAIFNLLPIPPLDGSKLWTCLLPRMRLLTARSRSILWMVLLAVLLSTNAMRPILSRAMGLLSRVLPASDAVAHEDRIQDGLNVMACGDAEALGRFTIPDPNEQEAAVRRMYQAAVRDFTAALEIKPHSHDALWARAMAYDRLRDWDSALADVAQAKRLAERPRVGQSDRDRIRVLELRIRGRQALDAKEFALAERYLDGAMYIDGSKSSELLYHRSLARIGQGDSHGALADLDRAIELDKTNPIYFEKRAAVLRTLGEDARALQDDQAALECRLRLMVETAGTPPASAPIRPQ